MLAYLNAMSASQQPMIRMSKQLMESISKDEFCILAYYQTKQPKTIAGIQKNLGIGTDRIIKTLSSLKRKLLIQGKSTVPESIEVMPTAIAVSSDTVCYLPTWVLFHFKGRTADKQILCYYLREAGNFQGTVDELAKGIAMKHRNANYSLNFLEKKNVISRVNHGFKIELNLLEQPLGWLQSLLGGA